MTLFASFDCNLGSFRLVTELQVPGRGVSALIGPSGCGKTSLLRAIAGLDRHQNGYVKVEDEIWQDKKFFVPVHKRALGYVFQNANLFPHMSVSDNLKYGLKRTDESRRTVSFDNAVELMSLESLLARSTCDLSGGEKQRVAMARALLSGPRLLLWDEPLASLDTESKAEILPFLASVPKELGLPVLFVSHSSDEVARLADNLIIMADGRIVGTGPVSEMLTRLDLPLSHQEDAEALVVATVAGFDEVDHLTTLQFNGGKILVTGTGLAQGSQVRLRIQARDVSLTLEPQSGTSILNVLPVTITEIATENDAQYLVRLDCNGTPLLSRVSHRSVRKLELVTGKKVYAQVKSIAVIS